MNIKDVDGGGLKYERGVEGWLGGRKYLVHESVLMVL